MYIDKKSVTIDNNQNITKKESNLHFYLESIKRKMYQLSVCKIKKNYKESESGGVCPQKLTTFKQVK